ncbi:MAG: hypothetical protein ACKO1M_11785 [Planctomycetota bacterium]
MHRVVAALLLVMAALFAGCSGKESAAPARGGKPGSAALTGLDPASRLDLDNGRVSVFSPQGWRRAPRSYDYLVRYQSTPQLPYPAVVVLAADPPQGFAEVTGENHAAFVEAFSAQLAEREGKGIVRKPARAKVGPHHAVSWAAGGEASIDGTTKKIERDCTAVVVESRLYTVEAWAPRGKLVDAGRAAARAVAAALAVPSLEPAEPLEPLVPPSEPTDAGKDATALEGGGDEPEMKEPDAAEPPMADAVEATEPKAPAAAPAE